MENVNEYKMEILDRCLKSDALTNLIAYDSMDAPFRDALSEDDKTKLLHSRLFPYRFVPNAVEDQATFLTIGFQGFRPLQEGYKIYDDFEAGEVNFYFFTHVDLMRTHAGTRPDLMLAEISKIFDSSRGIGIGELKLRYAGELWMHNNKFGGYNVAFTITDFK